MEAQLEPIYCRIYIILTKLKGQLSNFKLKPELNQPESFEPFTLFSD